MDYEETIAYIHSIPWMGKELGLSQISELLSMMGDPQNDLSIVHVAGTNGKGSVCEMTARILESEGYKTGFFLSPYIHRYNERIQVNHVPIADEALVELIARIKPLAERMAVGPSEFEIITAAAFAYYRQMKCDYVVLEVGMGGRLDATNVIPVPLAAVIATIGYDHTKHLGNTIAAIAYEKAGIIKPGGDVVAYGGGGEEMEVFRGVCRERGASLRFSDFSQIESLGEDGDYQYFSYKASPRYALSLFGAHQLKNAATVIELIALLREKGVAVSDLALAKGLMDARWPGRFETLSQDPLFIADGGHNQEGARAAADAFKRRYPGRSAVVLLGVTSGKDVGGIIKEVDGIALRYVVIDAGTSRAMPREALCGEVKRTGKSAETAASVREGVARALELAEPRGAVLSVGSLYTLADIRKYFGRE